MPGHILLLARQLYHVDVLQHAVYRKPRRVFAPEPGRSCVEFRRERRLDGRLREQARWRHDLLRRNSRPRIARRANVVGGFVRPNIRRWESLLAPEVREDKEISGIHGAVTVEVNGGVVGWVANLRSPSPHKHQQVDDVDAAIAVGIGGI